MKLLKTMQILKKAYDSMLNEISKKYKLTSNEIKILLFLNKNEETDIAKDIVDILILSKSHVSMSVDNLVNSGYLLRIQDEENKKKQHLKVTNKALDIITYADKKEEEFLNNMYSGITKEEKEIMNNIIEKMYNNIRDNYN